MFKLKNLDEQIITITGNKIADLTGKRTLTYRSALVGCLEMHRSSTPGSGEALRAFDLGVRIQKAKGSMDLEDEEKKFLEGIVENTSIFLSVVIGRLLYFLKDTKELKVEKK